MCPEEILQVWVRGAFAMRCLPSDRASPKTQTAIAATSKDKQEAHGDGDDCRKPAARGDFSDSHFHWDH